MDSPEERLYVFMLGGDSITAVEEATAEADAELLTRLEVGAEAGADLVLAGAGS